MNKEMLGEFELNKIYCMEKYINPLNIIYGMKGYKTIWIKGKQIRLHRYLMEQQLGRKLSFNEIVHHKDENIFNNNLDNLEWSTIKENIQHSVNDGRMNGNPKLILDNESGIFYDSIIDAAESLGMVPNTLVYKLLGKRKNNTNFIYA